MGFYSNARDEFVGIYNYYPKSADLNDFIKDRFKFYLKEKNKFFSAESNTDFIVYLRKKFYERYKFEPNDFDLFSYKLFGKKKNYVPSKIFLLVLMLFKDYHLTFSGLIGSSCYDEYDSSYKYNYYDLIIKILTENTKYHPNVLILSNFLYFTFISESKICKLMDKLQNDKIIAIKDNVHDYIKNTIETVNSLYIDNKYIFDKKFQKKSTKGKEIKLEFIALFEKLFHDERFKNELITALQTGNYTDNIVDWLFERGYHVYRAKSENFKFIFDNLDISNIHLPCIKDFTEIWFVYEYKLKKKISVIINSNYERYYLFGNLYFVLESEEHYIENLGNITRSNLFIDRIKKFINKYRFKPTIEQFIKYVVNENEFDILFQELKSFMTTGNLTNKVSILNFFKTDPKTSVPKNYYTLENELISCSEIESLNNVISAVCDDVLYIPPKDSWETIFLDIEFSNLKKVIVSKHFNKFEEKLFLGVLERVSLELVIEEPYATGEKVRALFGTRYYEEYRNEFLLTHSEAEWKYLVAPECVKETLKLSPNGNCHIIETYSGSWNNGINKTCWSEHYEAYEWDEQLHYWNYVYEHEYGSD